MNVRCEAGSECCGWESLLSVHYTTLPPRANLSCAYMAGFCAVLKVSCGPALGKHSGASLGTLKGFCLVHFSALCFPALFTPLWKPALQKTSAVTLSWNKSVTFLQPVLYVGIKTSAANLRAAVCACSGSGCEVTSLNMEDFQDTAAEADPSDTKVPLLDLLEQLC